MHINCSTSSLVQDILHTLGSDPNPSLHYLDVMCTGNNIVRAVAALLPQCTNLQVLGYECRRDNVSEGVEEEMWEAAVRGCKNLEEVKMRGGYSMRSLDILKSAMGKVSEREGIQALKLKRIMGKYWEEEKEDYTEEYMHLLPALQI